MKQKSPHPSQPIQKLAELIQDIRIAMLTTVHEDGALRSRPMAVQEAPFDGDLWFFTRQDSPKIHEIQEDTRVNVSFSAPSDNRYVSVTGEGELVHDPQKIRELWSPLLKAWFPEGLDDPNLALLRVHVENAEYWDTPSSTMVQIAGFVKAVVTGREYHPGENKKIDLAS